MARPPKDIDPEMVIKLASFGCTTTDIGSVLGCSDQTLNRRFGAELAEGRAKLRNRLRAKQVEVAMAGNTTMLIWLGKQLLGQADKQEIKTDTNASQVIRFNWGGTGHTKAPQATESEPDGN